VFRCGFHAGNLPDGLHHPKTVVMMETIGEVSIIEEALGNRSKSFFSQVELTRGWRVSHLTKIAKRFSMALCYFA
jgi:hypothetical protein